MHNYDYDHGIRALAARIRAAHDEEATRLEEQRRRCTELQAVDRHGQQRCCPEDA